MATDAASSPGTGWRGVCFFNWILFITFGWVCLHWDWKTNEWSFVRNHGQNTAGGLIVRTPKTLEEVLIDLSLLAIPLSVLGLVLVCTRPRKSVGE
jgi:hypothetical protein